MRGRKLFGEILKVIFIFTNCLLVSNISLAQMAGKPSLNILKYTQPQDFFKYKGDGSVLISGHRGGREKGYPENSIEGFQNVLQQIPAFFEIDPRLTKDSAIVLMHDETLDRTTTGKGLVSDYTWKQLQSFRLKDSDGNVTAFSIPTLEDVILWSKGKTVVNLDKKDVPMKMIAALIKKLDAVDHVMLTVHTGGQARYYYDRFPGIMLSAFVCTQFEYEEMEISGVPWQNMIAYIGPTINPANLKIVNLLHSKGVRCMISVASTLDQLETSAERQKAYLNEISKKPDIIESDIPTEIETALISR